MPRHLGRRSFGTVALAPVLGALAAKATERILDVTGRISSPGGTTSFDLDGLEAIGLASIATRTIWHPATSRFDGVPVTSLLVAVGAAPSSGARFLALDDYSASLGADEIARLRPLLATRRDGARLRVEDRGPIWLVFDYDRIPADLRNGYAARSVWQINRIIVG